MEVNKTMSDIKTEAQLQRQKVLGQQQDAEETARRQAAEATQQAEAQAEEARQKVALQAAEAQEKARAEALSQQAIVRKAQGEAERQAEALKGQAREARRVELRKQDLPFTKPERSIVNIGSYVKSVESARVEAHKQGRSARAEIEKIKDDYVVEVDKQLKDAIANIGKQELQIKDDIAKQLMEAQADIAQQVAVLLSGVDEWEAEGIAQLDKATAEYNNLLEGIAPYKLEDGYNLTAMIQAGYNANTLATYGFAQDDITNAQLMAEALDTLKPYKLEGDTYDITHAIVAAEKGEFSWWALNTVFGADVVEAERGNAKQLATFETYQPYITEDGTINVKGIMDKYGEAQAQVVLADLGVDNPYHAVNMTKPEYAFNYMQAMGEISANAKYIGVDEKTGEIIYVSEPTYDDWVKLYFKQPQNIQTSYIFRQAPYLGERSWSSLSEKEQKQVITDFQGEFSYLDSVLSMTKAEQYALAKRMLVGLIPVYGTIKNWDNMSTAWKAISVAIDVATIGLLVYGGIRTFPKAWHDFKVIVKDIHLDQRGFMTVSQITPKRLLQTKVITPGEAGLTEAEFARFLQARVLNPGLNPSTWAFLERMGQSLTKLIPTISASEARAFYGALLPSYAEIIAQGLPKASTWRPMQKIWKPGMSDTPTVGSLNQAASIMGMTTAGWSKLVNQMLPSKLPAGVQREVIVNAVLGLTADVALANSAMAMAKAKAQGKTQAEIARIGETAAQSTIQTALKALTQASTLTKAETATMTKLLNKTMTKAEVKTATKTLTQAATKADTKTATGTGTGTKTAVQTLTETVTKVQTKTKTKTRVRIKPKSEDEEKTTHDKEGRPIYPDGSVVWLMGELKRGQEWKAILPPYNQNKPISSTKPPHGVKVTSGTPQQTLTFIGGKPPFRNVAFDLGITDGYIDVKNKRIAFKGGGLATNVGIRIPSTTRGITLKGKSRRVIRQPSRTVTT